jgi:hypothetical protein
VAEIPAVLAKILRIFSLQKLHTLSKKKLTSPILRFLTKLQVKSVKFDFFDFFENFENFDKNQISKKTIKSTFHFKNLKNLLIILNILLATFTLFCEFKTRMKLKIVCFVF